MQQTTEARVLGALAPSQVIVLADRRRKRRSLRKHRGLALRSLVAIWFGVALLSALLIPAVLMSLALRHGVAGIGIAFALSTAVAWPFASRWLARGHPTRPATRSRAR